MLLIVDGSTECLLAMIFCGSPASNAFLTRATSSASSLRNGLGLFALASVMAFDLRCWIKRKLTSDEAEIDLYALE